MGSNSMDVDELFEFYKKEFIPAYSDLVGYIGDKPQQVLIELENVLSFDQGIFNRYSHRGIWRFDFWIRAFVYLS